MSKKQKMFMGIIISLFLLSFGFLIYIMSGLGNWIIYTSYLQDPQEIYKMETGIIKTLAEFQDGEDCNIIYDFENAEYPELLNRYGIEETAESGSEFEKAMRLMNEYSSRLNHLSNYDNHIDDNALALLNYSLDNKSHGINCRAKSQILNEMCLALHIYSRKVWINPNSVYDSDCHVVNEVWDTKLNQWVMLDITNNFYWVDENGKPLSILEIRDHLEKQLFCTPVSPSDNLDNLERSLQKNYDNFLYIAKNMIYMYYCTNNSTGETEQFFALMPLAYAGKEDEHLIVSSRLSIESAPFNT